MRILVGAKIKASFGIIIDTLRSTFFHITMIYNKCEIRRRKTMYDFVSVALFI